MYFIWCYVVLIKMIKSILFFLWWLGIVPVLSGALTVALMMTYIVNATNMSQAKVNNYKPLKIVPIVVAVIVEILMILLLDKYGNFNAI